MGDMGDMGGSGASMSREDVVAILCRLFAILLVVAAVREITQAALLTTMDRSILVPAAALSVPLLLAAGLLWKFPLVVARKLLPVMRTGSPALDPRSRTTLELALTAIGFWVLAMGIVDISYWINLLWLTHGSDASLDFDPTMKANLVATGVEVALGLWLVFGSRGLSAMALRLRYAGSGSAGSSQ